MELTSEISLSTIGELNQQERKKRNIGILSAAFIGAFFMLGFFVFAPSTKITSKSAQFAKGSHCECGENCSCGISCCCYVNGLK